MMVILYEPRVIHENLFFIERSQPWDPAIGYPHTVETGYYPATAQAPSGGAPVHDGRQRAPGIGAVFGNRSLDRSTLFSTQGLNGYLTETGRNLSQPSLAINRLVGAATGATGRRLPQPPPEAQKPLAMPLPNTPLPMLQRPVALSTRNR